MYLTFGPLSNLFLPNTALEKQLALRPLMTEVEGETKADCKELHSRDLPSLLMG